MFFEVKRPKEEVDIASAWNTCSSRESVVS